jgi:hypothetical protein
LNGVSVTTGEKYYDMMRNIFIYFVLFSFLNVSCQKIFFNEEEGTREILLNDFHAVDISGIYNIVLVQDSSNRLVIKGKNDINSVEALVNNDILSIDNHKNLSLNPNKNTLFLHFSILKNITINDPVNLSNTDTIVADRLTVVAVGEIAEVRLTVDCNYLYVVNDANTLGYFHFRGEAGKIQLWNRYGSVMYADSLRCKDAEVINESIGNINVNASLSVKAFIHGPGNIYYHGNPLIEIAENRGTGKIIRLD